MKKLFAMLLALVMCLALCVPVFADDPAASEGEQKPANSITIGEKTYTDQETVTIEKIYKLTNENTTSPAETFMVEQVGDGTVTDGEAKGEKAPALGDITGAAFEKGGATTAGGKANITIKLPTYTQVGVYEYTLKETVGTTAGVTYREESKTIKLVVTVVNGSNGELRIAGVHTEAAGESKLGSITNTYSAGSLTVSKKVTGLLGDKNKDFSFTVVFAKPEGKTFTPDITATKTDKEKATATVSADENNNLKYTFTLKDDESITFTNIPYGVTYKVEEDDYTKGNTGKYETTVNGTAGLTSEAEINSESVTVAYVNSKAGNIDTGVMLDSMPYVLALVIVAGGAAVMFARKRRVED